MSEQHTYDTDTSSMRGHYAGAASPKQARVPSIFTEDGRFIGLSDKEVAAKLAAEAAPLAPVAP